MGSWGDGPFDNDHAADWAWQVRSAATPQERTGVLTTALRGLLDTTSTFRLEPYDSFELDPTVEEAVAAVAFITDKARGRCHHTDTSFALGCRDEEPYDNLPPPELAVVSDALFALAMATLDRVERLLLTDPTADPYRQTLAALRADLAPYMTPDLGNDTAPARKLTGATTHQQEGTAHA